MAYTLQDLQTIEESIVSGRRKLRLNNREVEYQSVSQMIKARDLIYNDLVDRGLIVKKNRPRSFRISTCKGL